MQIRTLS